MTINEQIQQTQNERKRKQILDFLTDFMIDNNEYLSQDDMLLAERETYKDGRFEALSNFCDYFQLGDGMFEIMASCDFDPANFFTYYDKLIEESLND